MIIVIEGLTNTGKTTLCTSLSKNYSGTCINSLLKNDKIYKAISEVTNPVENATIMDRNTELSLYLALLSRKVEYIKRSNSNLIFVDRYALSIFSYFTVVSGFSQKYVYTAINTICNQIKPDITLLLDSDYSNILLRSRNSEFSRKDLTLSQTYLGQRASMLSNVSRFTNVYRVFENNNSFEELYDNVESYLDKFLE